MDAIYSEAIKQFGDWYQDARALDVNEPDAMTLATCTTDGKPTARVVLLRGFDQRGFAFYTNSRSRKGEQLRANPVAALCFYWDKLGRQVRAEGAVQEVSSEESDTYWARRHPRSRIASSVSQQSQRLPNREVYLRAVEEMESKFSDDNIPRPEHWHGFRVVPERIEFWKNVENRMHERFVFERDGDTWEKYLLYP